MVSGVEPCVPACAAHPFPNSGLRVTPRRQDNNLPPSPFNVKKLLRKFYGSVNKISKKSFNIKNELTTVNAKTTILLFAFCLITLGINAQSFSKENNVRVTCKKFDSNHRQFFVHTDDGDLIETGFYHANNPNLTWIQYGKDGNKLMLAQFQNGVKQGTWYIWDESGYLKYEISYLNNKIQSARELDRTGALVARR